MLRSSGINKYLIPLRRLTQHSHKSPIVEPLALHMELLERRLLLSCDTDFTGGVLTITCGAEDDSISVRIDAAGALLLNEVAITGAPSNP